MRAKKKKGSQAENVRVRMGAVAGLPLSAYGARELSAKPAGAPGSWPRAPPRGSRQVGHFSKTHRAVSETLCRILHCLRRNFRFYKVFRTLLGEFSRNGPTCLDLSRPSEPLVDPVELLGRGVPRPSEQLFVIHDDEHSFSTL